MKIVSFAISKKVVPLHSISSEIEFFLFNPRGFAGLQLR